jgi:hypothetical protein
MTSARSPAARLGALVLLVAVLFALLWSRLPLNDPPSYFAFADQRPLAGLPHACNVLSNLPFLAVAWAVWRRLGRHPALAWQGSGWLLTAGVALTALGSAWFHHAPSPATLFWDRLPMALTFSGVLLLLLADRFDPQLAVRLLLPLPLLAVATVCVWRWGGTLRPYLALQFGLMTLVPLVALRTTGRIRNRAVWQMFLAYGAAKLLEVFDAAIDGATVHLMAGHALKHLAAAWALWLLVRGLPATEGPTPDACQPVP